MTERDLIIIQWINSQRAATAEQVQKKFSIYIKIAVDVGIHAVGRNEEFRADEFAKNIGFGQSLARFLSQIEVMDEAPQNI